MSSNTQDCESSTKDVVRVDKMGREEDVTSLIAVTRSFMISETTFMAKNGSSFKNRLKNNDARECHDKKCFSSNMMQHMIAYFTNNLTGSEIKHCGILLLKDEDCRTTRLDSLEQAFDTAQ